MKLISLNLWGGRLSQPLLSFITRHSSEVDIFCFQEMNHQMPMASLTPGEMFNLFDEISSLLNGFVGYFVPQATGTGLAIFVRATITVGKHSSFTILSAEDLEHLKGIGGITYYPRLLQMISVQNSSVHIYNFHGLPGTNKINTPERDLQSERLQKILDEDATPKIIVGDFNLNPDTKGIRSLESGMKNLIKESNSRATRSSHYTKLSTIPFADYCFVSQGLKIKEFKVLQDEVSDHLPLFLDFSI